MPQVSGEGESVTLNNTIKAPFTLFSPEGHSEQESTSIADGDEYDSPSPEHEQPIKSAGENVNLFDKDNVSNGYLKSDGTIATVSTFRVSDYIDVSNFDNITISGNYGVSELNCFYDENKTFVSSFGMGTLTVNTKSVPSNAKYVRVTVRQDVLEQYKLEKGSTATPYSPFGMGSITEKIVNGNLLEITENNRRARCTYVSGANTNQYKLLCTAADMYVNEIQSTGTSYNKVRNGNLIPCTYGETIYFDTGNSLFANNYFTEFDENLISLGYYTKQISSGTYTPTNSNCKYVTYRFGYGSNAQVGTTYTLAPIVSKTPINSYISHEEQTYTIPTQAPFRSIGDVRDVFFKNTKDSPYYDENLVENGWYERHNINEQTMNLLSWVKVDNSSHSDSIIRFSSNVRNSNTIMSSYLSSKTLLSNRFICKYLGVAYTSECIAPHLAEKNQINVFIDKSRLTEETVQALNNYLDSIGAKVNYILENPLNLLCTTEQTNILENIPSTFAGQTNVFSEDEVKAYLEVSGIYDTKDLVTRVEVLESQS